MFDQASRRAAVVTMCFAQPRLMDLCVWVDTGHTLLSSARHSFNQSMHVAVCSTQLSHI